MSDKPYKYSIGYSIRSCLVREVKNIAILVVEDEEAIRELISDILSDEGHYVETACNGKEGLQMFAAKNYDMVFTDLIMPEMSGWELAEEIKNISSATPVALITGWRIDLPEAELQSRGVDFLITKPFRDEQLQKLVFDSIAFKEKL